MTDAHHEESDDDPGGADPEDAAHNNDNAPPPREIVLTKKHGGIALVALVLLWAVMTLPDLVSDRPPGRDTADAERQVGDEDAAAVEQWSADLTASPLGRCIEIAGDWAITLGDAAATNQPSYGALHTEMTVSIGSSTPEWRIINQGATVYAQASLTQGRAAGTVAAYEVVQDLCVTAHGTAEDNAGPVPGTDRSTGSPPSSGDSERATTESPNVEAFLADLAAATDVFAEDSDDERAARGWDACTLLEPGPTAAHPMGSDDLSEHPAFGEDGGAELFTAAAKHLCPQHRQLVEEAARLLDLEADEERYPLAPDLPDWAFEDPERVARTVMDAYVDGDREAAELLIAGELAEIEWRGMEPLQDPVPVCETDGEYRRLCGFDDGAYVVFLAQDRVTLQWVARYIEDLSGI